METIDIILQFLNPKELIQIGGLILLLSIVFAETGLFFGFFLPGDTLLFTAGMFCGTLYLDTSIIVLLVSLNVASIGGYMSSYYIGNKMGGYLLKKKDSFFFKKKHIAFSENFYKKHGGISLIVGRFFPIIRTFLPLVAGLSKVNFKRFMLYNVLGSFLWIGSLVLGGYYLGKKFPGVFDHLEWIIIGICILSTLPVIIALLKSKVKKNSINKVILKEEVNA